MAADAEFLDTFDRPHPSLCNIIENDSLKWIFVGGKGGVGKTTISSALAVQLARRRESVLIISTDPAHNLSDAFDQKFSKVPTRVQGFQNLYAMEVDPQMSHSDMAGEIFADDMEAMKTMMRDVMNNMPGIDEAMAYIEFMSAGFWSRDVEDFEAEIRLVLYRDLRLVRKLNYSIVVFDTAPTGHTLRLLQFPMMIEKTVSQMLNTKSNLLNMMSGMTRMMGMPDITPQSFANQLESIVPDAKTIIQQLQDKAQTTFVCVCIAEFLSMFETERLIQELRFKLRIDVHNVVVNQLLFVEQPPRATTASGPSAPAGAAADAVLDASTVAKESSAERPPTSHSQCRMCLARYRIQSKYLEQIFDLYDDMHVVLLPLLEHEVRGAVHLEAFSRWLVDPFAPDREPRTLQTSDAGATIGSSGLSAVRQPPVSDGTSASNNV